MKAWIHDDVVLFILPSEADPDRMGKIYDIDFNDYENLQGAKSNQYNATRLLTEMNQRLVNKLRREQPDV